ncbi:MAG: IgA Peptidase M64 [Bacteroidales bacterium]|nr:IgA Peptidase M64 [Bacteroidales bacterium]
MKKLIPILLGLTIIMACTQVQTENTEESKAIPEINVVNKGNVVFDDFFKNKTMRLDYFHTGNSETEHFATDKIISDGDWYGSTKILIDELELGYFFFEVIDQETKALLYSRGFSSIFGEWQTTPEAQKEWGTFHESVRFPWPVKPITVRISKRDSQNNFQPIWTYNIDPESRLVNPTDIKHTEEVVAIHKSGNPNEKLDLVLLGDGYTAEQMDKFIADAKRVTGYLLNAEPYKSRKNDINVWAVKTPSQESGISRPHPEIHKRTALSAHYSSFDSERYVLAYDNKTIRNVASAAPYEFTSILINEQTYGGGGIYKLYTTNAVDNKFAEYIMIHEMGHHLADLADEYYSSATAYEAPTIDVEPYETNVTALLDKENLKWKHLVEEETPIPTPWNKEEFDEYDYAMQKERGELRAAKVEESVMEDFFMRVYHKRHEFFTKDEYKDKIGAFEGAKYNQYGLYRSQLDCIMFTRHTVHCKVCQNSISIVIDQYSK